MSDLTYFIEKAAKFGCPESTARALYRKHWTTGKLDENPYLLTYHGVSFADVEKGAASKPQYAENRVRALVDAALEIIMNSGSTRTTVREIARVCRRIEKAAGVFENPTPPLVLAPSVLEACIIEEGKIAVPKNLYYAEREAAKKLKRIDKNAENIQVQSWAIMKIEHGLGIRYDDTQKKAFECLEHGVSVLTGGPGTGKTTVLKGIIAAWEGLAYKPVVLCAPTGKAAKVLREATGTDAQTIHMTLGLKPYDGKRKKFRRERMLEQNALVIVDEASMIDAELAEYLFDAVMSANGKLLLVGDEDQLQSVGPGSVLRDVIASGLFHVSRLSIIHRQDAGAIVQNAARVCEGNAVMLSGSDFTSQRVFTDEDTAEMAVQEFLLHYKPESPQSCKIYTPVRSAAYKCSTSQLNNVLHNFFRLGKPELTIGKENVRRFCVGDPVIITHNDYDLGVLNGDEGRVVALSPLTVEIDGEQVVIDGEMLQYIELSYAVTIHKAQGSSCKNAIIIMPTEPHCMLSRRLLYVAITRAEEHVYLLHQGEALEEAVRNQYEQERITSLSAFLGGGQSVRKSA